MILYDKYSNFLGMSSTMLNFLGFEDLEEFKAIYKDVADLFVEKRGYIYKFKNFSWIEYALHSGTPNKKVLITLKNSQVIESELKIKEIYLINPIGESDKFYMVEFINSFFNNQPKTNLPSISKEEIEAATLLQESKEKYKQEPLKEEPKEENEIKTIDFDSLTEEEEKKSNQSAFEFTNSFEEQEDFESLFKEESPLREEKEEIIFQEDIFKEESKEEDLANLKPKDENLFEDLEEKEENEIDFFSLKKEEDEKEIENVDIFEKEEKREEIEKLPINIFEENEEEKSDQNAVLTLQKEEVETKEEKEPIMIDIGSNFEAKEEEEENEKELFKTLTSPIEITPQKEEEKESKKDKDSFQERFLEILKPQKSKKEPQEHIPGKKFKLKKELEKEKKNKDIGIKESFENLGISTEEEKELIEDFVIDMEKNISLIRKHIVNKNYTKIADILNIVKSAANILNIKSIANKADRMQEILKEESIETFSKKLKELESDTEELKYSLEKIKI